MPRDSDSRLSAFVDYCRSDALLRLYALAATRLAPEIDDEVIVLGPDADYVGAELTSGFGCQARVIATGRAQDQLGVAAVSARTSTIAARLAIALHADLLWSDDTECKDWFAALADSYPHLTRLLILAPDWSGLVWPAAEGEILARWQRQRQPQPLVPTLASSARAQGWRVRSAVVHTDVVLGDAAGSLDRAVERRIGTELAGLDGEGVGPWRDRVGAARASGDYWFSLPLYVVSCTLS